MVMNFSDFSWKGVGVNCRVLIFHLKVHQRTHCTHKYSSVLLFLQVHQWFPKDRSNILSVARKTAQVMFQFWFSLMRYKIWQHWPISWVCCPLMAVHCKSVLCCLPQGKESWQSLYWIVWITLQLWMFQMIVDLAIPQFQFDQVYIYIYISSTAYICSYSFMCYSKFDR